MKILDQIKFIDENICENIDKNLILNDRGFLSQNILSQLRNLVEHCSMYINLRLNGLDDNISLEEAKKKIPSIPNRVGGINNDFRFIIKFHNLLVQKPNCPTLTRRLPICPLSEFNLLNKID